MRWTSLVTYDPCRTRSIDRMVSARPQCCLPDSLLSPVHLCRGSPPRLPAWIPAGAALRDLVAIGSGSGAARQAVFQARSANPRWNPAHAAHSLPGDWAEFFAFHCACLAALVDGDSVEAYDKAVAALQPFLRVCGGGVWGGGVGVHSRDVRCRWFQSGLRRRPAGKTSILQPS